jgi:hypothetical protein
VIFLKGTEWLTLWRDVFKVPDSAIGFIQDRSKINTPNASFRWKLSEGVNYRKLLKRRHIRF